MCAFGTIWKTHTTHKHISHKIVGGGFLWVDRMLNKMFNLFSPNKTASRNCRRFVVFFFTKISLCIPPCYVMAKMKNGQTTKRRFVEHKSRIYVCCYSMNKNQNVCHVLLQNATPSVCVALKECEYALHVCCLGPHKRIAIKSQTIYFRYMHN